MARDEVLTLLIDAEDSEEAHCIWQARRKPAGFAKQIDSLVCRSGKGWCNCG
jgi:hypothetical protein